MAIVHGWKAFSIVEEQGDNVLMDEEGGQLHSAVATSDSPTFDGNNGHVFYTTLEGAWRDATSVYAHITGIGKAILHEHGGRTTQYSVDYFLGKQPEWEPKLVELGKNLNISLLALNDEEGCPFCRTKTPTEEMQRDWLGDSYGR